MNENQTIISALKLGLGWVERSERLAYGNAKNIYFIVIKFDMGLQSWQELKPKIAEYRNALKILRLQDEEMLKALGYLDNLYASLEQSVCHDEKAPISFCLSNQPKDLAHFASDMARYQKKITSLIRFFN